MKIETLCKVGLGAVIVGAAAASSPGAVVAASIAGLGAAATALRNTTSEPSTSHTSSLPWLESQTSSSPLPWLRPSSSPDNPQASRSSQTKRRSQANGHRSQPKRMKSSSKASTSTTTKTTTTKLNAYNENAKLATCQSQQKSAETSLTMCTSEKLVFQSLLTAKTQEASASTNRATTCQALLTDSNAAKTTAEAKSQTLQSLFNDKTTAEQQCQSERSTLNGQLQTSQGADSSCQVQLGIKDQRIAAAEKESNDAKAGITDHCFLMTKGATGVQGPAGAAGPKGKTGEKGNIGPMGPAGSIGSTGPSGRDGAIGLQGPSGPAGVSNTSTVTTVSIFAGICFGSLSGGILAVIGALRCYGASTGLTKRAIRKYQMEGMRAQERRQKEDSEALMLVNKTLNEQVRNLTELTHSLSTQLKQQTKECDDTKRAILLQDMVHKDHDFKLKALEELNDTQSSLLSRTFETLERREQRTCKVSKGEVLGIQMTRRKEELNLAVTQFKNNATLSELKAMGTLRFKT